MGVELFPTDGQTDMAKLIIAFRNFTKAPKHGYLTFHVVVRYVFMAQCV